MTKQNKTVHSKIGASSMYRWSKCPGSVSLCEKLPPQAPSSYAEEGTKAHNIAADFLEKDIALKGESEMNDAIATYLEYCLTISECITPKHIHVEHSFDMSTVYPGLYGTADYACYHAVPKILHVVDYKHGAGIAVEIKNNSQLMYYGLGALTTLKYPCRDVVLTVVQPRCPHPDGPIRSWTISAIDLIDFEADLVEFAKKTEEPNAPLKSGDHCRWCAAAGVCPQLHKEAKQLAKATFAVDAPYDKELLGRCLTWLPRLESWIKSVREFGYNQALQGKTPNGFKLVDKRATRKWRDADDITHFLRSQGHTENKTHETKLKSPTQIEKLFSKPERPMLEPYIIKQSSGKTLVSSSDKRPAAINDPKLIFDKVT